MELTTQCYFLENVNESEGVQDCTFTKSVEVQMNAMKGDIIIDAAESKIIIKLYVDHVLQKNNKGKGKHKRNRTNMKNTYMMLIQEETKTILSLKSISSLQFYTRINFGPDLIL